MANCGACTELRETDTSFIVNGLTDAHCTSLMNDTGLNPSSGNDDCEDLHNINDCLVGNMESEIDAYDVCDWKAYMKRFVPNVATTLKAIICAICGLWDKVHCILNTNISEWTSITSRDNKDKITVNFEQYVRPREETDPSDREAYTAGLVYSLSAAQVRLRVNIQKELFLNTQDFQHWYDPTKKWDVQALGGISSIYFKLFEVHVNKAKTGIKRFPPHASFMSAYNGMGVHGYFESWTTATECVIAVYLNQVIMWGGAMNENNPDSQILFTWDVTVPIETELSFDC